MPNRFVGSGGSERPTGLWGQVGLNGQQVHGGSGGSERPTGSWGQVI